MGKNLNAREVKRRDYLKQFESADLLPSMTYRKLEIDALKKLIENIFVIEENVNNHRKSLYILNRDSRALLVATKRMEKQITLLRKEVTGILEIPGIFYTFTGKSYKGGEYLDDEDEEINYGKS